MRPWKRPYRVIVAARKRIPSALNDLKQSPLEELYFAAFAPERWAEFSGVYLRPRLHNKHLPSLGSLPVSASIPFASTFFSLGQPRSTTAITRLPPTHLFHLRLHWDGHFAGDLFLYQHICIASLQIIYGAPQCISRPFSYALLYKIDEWFFLDWEPFLLAFSGLFGWTGAGRGFTRNLNVKSFF